MRRVETKLGIYGPTVDRPDERVRRDVTASVRTARTRLSTAGHRTGSSAYELLHIYARNQLDVAMGVPLLAVVAAIILAFWIPIYPVLVWLGATIICKTVIFMLCRRFLNLPADAVRQRQWRLKFAAGELAYSTSWAGLALLEMPTDVRGLAPHTFVFVSLLIILAVRTMLSSNLLTTVVAGTMPIMLAILFHSLQFNDPVHYGLTVIALSAQSYFFYISRRLARSNVAMIELRSQKDALIAELEQAKSISDEARRRAESANLAKSRFLATMSHELRTPLNAILGFSEVMKNEVLGPHSMPTYQEYAEDIHRSGQLLLNLINEVLDLSRIEAGRYKLQEDSISLAYTVDDCMRLVELRARERGISLVARIEQDMPKIWADERALRQICLNLLSNAIKFSYVGAAVTVKVGWTESGGQYLTVADTGPGIPEDELPQILTSFGQGALAQKIAEQGAGLGLPIVQGLIQLHGGTFAIKSELRVGTEVTVALPRSRVMLKGATDPQLADGISSAA